VRIVDPTGNRLATLHRVRGKGSTRLPKWKALVKPLPTSLAGRRVAIELEAVDRAPGAMVEAGVDQLRVTNE
jgi:hypothetical protein